MDLTELYKNQISLSEWFEKSNHSLTNELRLEDNEKRERLKELNELINLPFDKPYQFDAKDIANKSNSFVSFLQKHSEELCALRLIPLDQNLPKLRMRGHTIKEVLKWFSGQNIDPPKYRADFVPHSENQLWSTIFVINEKGIFGEIIRGGHHQLTQGFYGNNKPNVFTSDFRDIYLSTDDEQAKTEIKNIIKKLEVKDQNLQNIITEKLNAKFTNNYLLGYFETVTTKEFGLWFVDYNRILGDLYKDYTSKISENKLLNVINGLTGSPGEFIGKAKIINESEIENSTISKDEILICKMTTPQYLFQMKNAGAIITDLGGILSHAAIIAREFKIPCLVGTESATKIFRCNDTIEVNATEGYARKL